ncbi:hypothetical protein CC1G_03532 [Coprinopsis cinerea okayama7|uniref:Uncharacterized protein n=1 Tax=Coprinopsis cinerea (strain Okayama-7 / 130 / ATCC MYA-4618 / FGSC 9003) TaxID=240176 RepID=A8NCH4_COPC7|nr:hypothetical protein CC1G_03532 [Coprinopsis cinerea okayama7\|eukprot:XP_001832518.1 hypothetical protein CC1G_03532 [Coprinopsis cinerea okayama7\
MPGKLIAARTISNGPPPPAREAASRSGSVAGSKSSPASTNSSNISNDSAEFVSKVGFDIPAEQQSVFRSAETDTAPGERLGGVLGKGEAIPTMGSGETGPGTNTQPIGFDTSAFTLTADARAGASEHLGATAAAGTGLPHPGQRRVTPGASPGREYDIPFEQESVLRSVLAQAGGRRTDSSFNYPLLGTGGQRASAASSLANLRGFATNNSNFSGTQLEPGPVSRLSSMLTALMVLGLGITAYSIGNLSNSLSLWPMSLRSDLRAGLDESVNPSPESRQLAADYLSRAWSRALELPISRFGDEDPHLKLTGIALALGGILEEDGNIQDAYTVYKQALTSLQVGLGSEIGSSTSVLPTTSASAMKAEAMERATNPLLPSLSTRERMRAVGLSYKLAELAEELKLPKSEQEKWLVYSSDTVIADVLESEELARVTTVEEDVSNLDGSVVEMSQEVVGQLNPPWWAQARDLAAPLVALGKFYVNEGKVDDAIPLYVQAINILNPPEGTANVSDRCHAAQLMGNVSELMVRSAIGSNPKSWDTSPSFASSVSSFAPIIPGHPSVKSSNSNPNSAALLREAEGWAIEGLGTAQSAQRADKFDHNPDCEMAHALNLFNLAVLRELNGEQSNARTLFTQSLEESKGIGFKEGIKNAERAIRNLGSNISSSFSRAELAELASSSLE